MKILHLGRMTLSKTSSRVLLRPLILLMSVSLMDSLSLTWHARTVELIGDMTGERENEVISIQKRI
jgi:hypothetical protein